MALCLLALLACSGGRREGKAPATQAADAPVAAQQTEEVRPDTAAVADTDTLLYYYHYPGLDNYPDLTPEDSYMELHVRDGVVRKGFFRGTTDIMDDAREGYKCGFFVLPMTDITHARDSISFTLKTVKDDEGETVNTFARSPVALNVYRWEEAVKLYGPWEQSPRGLADSVQISIHPLSEAMDNRPGACPLTESVIVRYRTEFFYGRIILDSMLFVAEVGAQSTTVAKQIREFYVEYMKAVDTRDHELEDRLFGDFLTPEMLEKKGRLTAATGADPLLRAQDVSDYGSRSLQCRHLKGDWYEVSYRWCEEDSVGFYIPLKVEVTDAGKARIMYITPECEGRKYGDGMFHIQAAKVDDSSDALTFVETFYKAYTYPYVKMVPHLERELERLRKAYCTPEVLERYAVIKQEHLEDGGDIDPLINHADFDAFWYASLRVEPLTEDTFQVSYICRDARWKTQLKVTVAKQGGKFRITDLDLK